MSAPVTGILWNISSFMKGIDNSTFVSRSNSYARYDMSVNNGHYHTHSVMHRSALTTVVCVWHACELTILLSVMLIWMCPKFQACKAPDRITAASIPVGELTTGHLCLPTPRSVQYWIVCNIKLKQHEVQSICVDYVSLFMCKKNC